MARDSKGPQIEHWRSLWRTVSCGRDPRLEQGKSVMSPAPEEEGAAEAMCGQQTATPIPLEEVEKIRSKDEPRKKGGVG